MQEHNSTILIFAIPFFKLNLLANTINAKNNKMLKKLIFGIGIDFALFDINIINQFGISNKGFNKISAKDIKGNTKLSIATTKVIVNKIENIGIMIIFENNPIG